jgi:hypothetical protein
LIRSTGEAGSAPGSAGPSSRGSRPSLRRTSCRVTRSGSIAAMAAPIASRRPPPPWRMFQLSPLIPPLPHHLPAPHEGPGLPPGSLATPPRQLNGKLKIAPDSSAEASSASSGPSSGVRA